MSRLMTGLCCAAMLLVLSACGSEPAKPTATVSPAPAPAPPASALSGTWVINLAKSTYSPADLAPQSGTTKIEVTPAPQDGPDWIKVITDGVDSKGRKTHTEYTATLDGTEVPTNGMVDGRPNLDADGSSWTQTGKRAYETTSRLKGKVLTTTQVVVAADGKTRTLAVTGKNAQGQTVKNTVVYDKQ